MDFRGHASTVRNNGRVCEVALVGIDALYLVERYSKKGTKELLVVFAMLIVTIALYPQEVSELYIILVSGSLMV
jgi:hypothetical protein